MRQCEARQSASCFKTAWQDVESCERDQFCGVFARGVGGTGPANVNVHSAPDFPTRPTVMSTPICRTRSGCYARAASGQAVAPPSSVMNSRRLMSSMGSSPEPAIPAYRSLRMYRKRPQVLGADLNRSES